MRIKDINADISFSLGMKAEYHEDLPTAGIGRIQLADGGSGYKLVVNNTIWRAKLKSPSKGVDLNYHLSRGCAHLIEVDPISKGEALVTIVFFGGDIIEMGDIEIAIDDGIVAATDRQSTFDKGDAFGEASSILQERCLISVGGKSFFVIMNGGSASGNGTNNVDTSKEGAAFSICGRGVQIHVKVFSITEDRKILLATRAVYSDPPNKIGSLRLVEGSIGFSNYTKGENSELSKMTEALMGQLVKDSGSYLRQWSKYGMKEEELLLERAKKVGAIAFHSPKKTTAGVKLFINTPLEHLSGDDEVELLSEEPSYLKEPTIDWEEYSGNLATKKKGSEREEEKGVRASIIKILPDSIELRLEAIPEKKKLIVLSISGDQIQIKRRKDAWDKIVEGKSVNPTLGLVIEEKGMPPMARRVTKIKPLTSFVREKIFEHEPTSVQQNAIAIALNTPDIALIQGPPGTGKTTVATAIVERLNEDFDKSRAIKGQVLVSGYQHDAVENIVSRLSVNALPAVKFGKRYGNADSGDLTADRIDKWCSDIAESLQRKNPQLVQTKEQLTLHKMFNAYIQTPSRNIALKLMKEIRKLPRSIITDELAIDAAEIANSIREEAASRGKVNAHILRLIRSLRESEVSFADDGAARAMDLLVGLEGIKDSQPVSKGVDVSIIEEAASWRQGSSPLKPLLSKLRALKMELLEQYLPSYHFSIEKPREDVLLLNHEVQRCLKDSQRPADQKEFVLAEFMVNLENNPLGARRAIEDYNFVYASTTQQSAGKLIKEAKDRGKNTASTSSDTTKYDTIIIDEASRVSPQDILVPMALAEKRIILIGDHRQLPHMVNEEIIKALEQGDPTSLPHENDFIKDSMFEYLFKRLKVLEERDGITRTITLNKQFRSHPLLGRFVSSNFYEEYGEGYRSPLKEDLFSQNLEGLNGKAAVWIDAPHGTGTSMEKKMPSGSRKRVVEAEIIAKYAKKWIDSEEGKDLSFGVISFYKAQVSEIYRELGKVGLAESSKSHKGETWAIKPEYQFLENGSERLRIGTVDAFQGMEFDIVLLSMVRSINTKGMPGHIQNEKDEGRKQTKIFGHLMSENRLCVSMSRQKRVLVVVGDAALASSKIGGEAVPALKGFYDLCHTDGVVL